MITSSCDSFPVDGSHTSSAHAFLLLGARTVLSTLTPVHVIHASVFIARLILRITDVFLKKTIELQKIITWSEIVTGLKRMVYLTDLIDWVLKRYKIYHPQFKSDLMLEANMLINPLSYQWYEKFIDYLSDQICVAKYEIESEICHNFVYSEVLSYVQLGNPDALLIIDD